MPQIVSKGCGWQGSISETIRALIAEGKSQDEAAAIAYEMARAAGVSKSITREINLSLPICKFDDEQKTVTGWAAASTDDLGQPVIDFQDEYIPVDEMAKAAHRLMIDGGTGAAGEMHMRRAGDIVESMVVDKAKRKALGFGDPPSGQPEEGWAVTMRLDDQAWRNYKSGDRPELSVHGLASMTPIGKRDGRTVYMRADLQVDEISIVDGGASGNSRVKPRIVLAKRNASEQGASKQGAGEQERTMPVKNDKQTDGKDEVKKALELLSKQGLDALVELEAAGFSDEQKKIVYALLEAAKGGAPAAKPAVPPVPPAKGEGETKIPEPPPVAKSKDTDPKDPISKALAQLKPEDREAVEKALSEKSQSEERQAMEKRHSEEKAELVKRVDELEKSRKQLEDDRELSEMTKRAEKRPYIPNLSTEAQAQLLLKAKRSLDKEAFEALDKVMTSVNEGMSKSEILRQFGSDKDGDSDSAAGKLETMTKKLMEEVRKSSTGKRMSKAQAYAEVCRQNPELYAEATKGEDN